MILQRDLVWPRAQMIIPAAPAAQEQMDLKPSENIMATARPLTPQHAAHLLLPMGYGSLRQHIHNSFSFISPSKAGSWKEKHRACWGKMVRMYYEATDHVSDSRNVLRLFLTWKMQHKIFLFSPNPNQSCPTWLHFQCVCPAATLHSLREKSRVCCALYFIQLAFSSSSCYLFPLLPNAWKLPLPVTYKNTIVAFL